MGGKITMDQGREDKRQKRLILKKEVIINNAVKGYALDVSIGGMYIYAPIQQPKGNIVDLRFDLEDGGPTDSNKGPCPVCKSGCGDGNVIFNLSVESAERIKKFVEKTCKTILSVRKPQRQT